MVFSRRLLRQGGLLLRLLGIDGRDDLSSPCKAFHALELLLAVEQRRPQPTLEHPASSCAFDNPLAGRPSCSAGSSGSRPGPGHLLPPVVDWSQRDAPVIAALTMLVARPRVAGASGNVSADAGWTDMEEP